MMNTLIINNYIYFFILIMSRYLGIFLLTPVLGSPVLLSRIKVILAFFMAIVTYPVLKKVTIITMPAKTILILSGIIKELTIGVLVGFTIFIVFAAVQLAGQFIDLRMGFRIANIFDPISGASSPIIGQFKNIFFTLVFLAINGHHIIINNLYKSFSILPPGQIKISGMLWQYIFRKSGNLFIIAFKIALPVMGTIFIIDVILGFLARSVPQMNIFIIGLPVKIVIGFVFLLLTIHIIIYYYSDILYRVLNEMIELFKIMAPS